MRRLMPIAAFALCLALPLWAQHGGGGHAGFSGGHAGAFTGGRVGGGNISGGMHSSASVSRNFSHAPSSAHHNFSHQPFLHNGFHGHPFYNHGFRNYCYGYSCRGGYGYYYPWAYGGYYDPYWWGDSGSSYDADYERDRAMASEMNAQSWDEQRMRRQQDQDYRDEYGNDRDHYARSTPAPSEPESAVPETVLIFRDQHKLEVRNYAIVGQTLWNFAPQHTQKIPLFDLDITATSRANDDRGLTFRIPANSEAQ
jgi:hypothetical protein